MNPGKYGGLIARRISGGGVELREIISVIEMSEYEEAMATGYPFFFFRETIPIAKTNFFQGTQTCKLRCVQWT